MLILPTPFVRSWPDHEGAPAGVVLPAGDALTREWPTDAHFVAYSAERRLSGRAIEHGPVRVGALVLDVDGPDHGRTPEWDAALLEKAGGLPGAPFGYFTRGGARFLWRLAQPFVVADVDDAEAWARFYLLAAVEVAAVTGIVADPACSDWTRLYRLPHATRDGAVQRHGWVCGSPTSIGTWPGVTLSEAEATTALGWLSAQSPAWARRACRLAPPRPRRRVEARGDGGRALRWAAERVAGAGAGDRNAELFRRGRFLAGLVQRGELGAEEAATALVDAGKAAGLTQREAARTVRSALRGAA